MVFSCSSYSMGVAMNDITISICLAMMCFMGMTAFIVLYQTRLSKIGTRDQRPNRRVKYGAFATASPRDHFLPSHQSRTNGKENTSC
jgi:hypothetical protein